MPIRLLNVRELSFKVFIEPSVPRYVVASHRWTNDEASFKDVLKQRNQKSLGFQKLSGFCHHIRKHLLDQVEWLWMDTVCINQTSSAEVDEAINTMCQWYQQAYMCIAYLSDISSRQVKDKKLCLTSSVWFTRGWTLQELLVPNVVLFLSADWQHIGYKTDAQLLGPISTKTGIPAAVLKDSRALRSIPIEERVRWAHGRQTTRTEDLAYCLLGICGVYMVLIYGEGQNAWDRLEEEVSKRCKRDIKLSRPRVIGGR